MKLENFGYSGVCIKIYNPANQTLIETRSNFKTAGAYLGIKETKVVTNCRNKKRVFSPHLNIEVSVRVANESTLPVGVLISH